MNPEETHEEVFFDEEAYERYDADRCYLTIIENYYAANCNPCCLGILIGACGCEDEEEGRS